MASLRAASHAANPSASQPSPDPQPTAASTLPHDLPATPLLNQEQTERITRDIFPDEQNDRVEHDPALLQLFEPDRPLEELDEGLPRAGGKDPDQEEPREGGDAKIHSRWMHIDVALLQRLTKLPLKLKAAGSGLTLDFALWIDGTGARGGVVAVLLYLLCPDASFLDERYHWVWKRPILAAILDGGETESVIEHIRSWLADELARMEGKLFTLSQETPADFSCQFRFALLKGDIPALRKMLQLPNGGFHKCPSCDLYFDTYRGQGSGMLLLYASHSHVTVKLRTAQLLFEQPSVSRPSFLRGEVFVDCPARFFRIGRDRMHMLLLCKEVLLIGASHCSSNEASSCSTCPIACSAAM